MIFLATGGLGTGKTLWMVRQAVLTRLKDKAAVLEEERELVPGSLSLEAKKGEFRSLFEYAVWLENEPTEREGDTTQVVSNIVLSGIKHLLVRDQNEFVALLEREKAEESDILVDCLFLLDEAQTFVDSRRSGSKLNLIYDYFFEEMRKRGNDFLGTTQDPSKIDVRLRNLTDWWVRMIPYNKEDNIAGFRAFNPQTGQKNKTPIIFPTTRFFPFYNTYERIRKQGKRFKLKAEDLR